MPTEYFTPTGFTRYFEAPPTGAPAPLARFQFDGTGSSLTDRENSYDLSMEVGSAAYITPAGNITGFNFNSNKSLIAPNTEDLRLAVIEGGGGDASATIEFLLRPTSSSAVTYPFFSVGSGGESPQSNFLNYLYYRGEVPAWRYFGEYANGSNVDLLFDGLPITINQDFYIVFTVSADGVTRKMYVNAVNSLSLTGTAATKGSSGNAQRFRIGRNDASSYFRGVIYGMRYSDYIYSADQIEEVLEQVTEGSKGAVDGVAAGFSGEAELLGAGGRLRHDGTVSSGQRIPGPTDQAPGSVGPFPAGAIEESLVLPSAGGRSWHDAEGITEGAQDFFPKPSGGYAEEVVVEITDADYIDGKLDGDGAELLDNASITEAKLINTSEGSFGNPTGANHYGAAQDGKFYHDGNECGIGPFTTAGGAALNRTAWAYNDDDPMAMLTSGYLEAHTPPTIVSDGKIALDATHVIAGFTLERGVSSQRRWFIEAGDFDVEFEYDNFGNSGGADGYLLMTANLTNDNGADAGILSFSAVRVFSRNTTNQFFRDSYYDNAQANSTNVSATSAPTGKMRMVRTGNNFECFYDNGGGWTTIGGSFVPTGIDGNTRLFIEIFMLSSNPTNATANIFNFSLNSGTTDNKAPWYHEASGAHRGTQAAMPEDLAVVLTPTSMNLIDAVNNKLWMRFLVGSDNLFRSGMTAPRRVYWLNGVLYVAHVTGSEGCGMVIDFRQDIARCHRLSACDC